jgi:hypothetical protein
MIRVFLALLVQYLVQVSDNTFTDDPSPHSQTYWFNVLFR